MPTANEQVAMNQGPVIQGRPIQQLDLEVPAKINLFLEILGKRPDGFHELETVMTTVALADHLRIALRDDSEIRLTLVGTSGDSAHRSATGRTVPADTEPAIEPAIPTDDRNLVVRALLRLREQSGSSVPMGCDVWLWKNIPSAAGLGGASSDAAAALAAGNRLWNLNFSPAKLLELAAEIGSDVPFFLVGGMAVCRGRGERIEALAASAGMPIVIAHPSTGLATAQVFGRVVPPTTPVAATEILRSIAEGSYHRVADQMFNRLQPFASILTPEVERLATAYSQIQCLGHQMSGSGSSYFGVFSSHREARIAARTLAARLPDVKIICTETSPRRSMLVHERLKEIP